jgi:hypothetical protein
MAETTYPHPYRHLTYALVWHRMACVARVCGGPRRPALYSPVPSPGCAFRTPTRMCRLAREGPLALCAFGGFLVSDEGSRQEEDRRRRGITAVAGAGVAAIAGEVRVAIDMTGGIDTTGPDLTAAILNIAADIRAMLPLLGQLVEALSKLGNNSTGGLTVRLGSANIRIAELSVAILEQEARSEQPKSNVEEQCLRVCREIIVGALDIVKLILIGVIVEELMRPEETEARFRAIVSAIDHVLPLLTP